MPGAMIIPQLYCTECGDLLCQQRVEKTQWLHWHVRGPSHRCPGVGKAFLVRPDGLIVEYEGAEHTIEKFLTEANMRDLL